MESISADKIGSTPRFDLKSLFLLLTAAAVLLAPVSWFGFNYFVNAALSVTLIIVCVLAYGEAKRTSAIVVAIVGAFVGFVIAIGAVAGGLGSGLAQFGPMHAAERVLAAIAGLFMSLVGLEMLGLLPRFSHRGAALVQAPRPTLASSVACTKSRRETASSMVGIGERWGAPV